MTSIRCPRLNSTRILGVMLLAALVAGCSDESAPTLGRSTNENVPTAAPATFSDETGGIEARVLDDSYLPLAGAQVALQGAATVATSDEAGRASFSDVIPGKVVVLVSQEGYRARARAVTVLQGEVTKVDLILEKLPSTEPYHQSFPFSGTIFCQMALNTSVQRIATYCATNTQSAAASEKFIFQLPVMNATGLSTLLAETSWQSTQVLGNELHSWCRFTLKNGTAGFQVPNQPSGVEATVPPYCPSDSGPSPLRIEFSSQTACAWVEERATAQKQEAPKPCPTGMTIAFTMGSYPHHTGDGFTLTFSQKFEDMVTTFWNAPAPEGFSAFPDQ